MSLLSGIDLRPRDVHGALEALREVTRRLEARDDPRAHFPEIYGLVTEAVATALTSGEGLFQEPAWVSRVAGRFCERYLETLAWSLDGLPQDCTSWMVAYDCAARGTTFPFQDVLLGLNAHINFDLAQGSHQTLVEFGCQNDPRFLARCQQDHQAVNVLLRRTVGPTLTTLAERHGCPVSAALLASREHSQEVILALLSYWREGVWQSVLALQGAGSHPQRFRVVQALERHSGRVALTAGLPLKALAHPIQRCATTAWSRSVTLLGRQEPEQPVVRATG